MKLRIFLFLALFFSSFSVFAANTDGCYPDSTAYCQNVWNGFAKATTHLTYGSNSCSVIHNETGYVWGP